MHPVAHRAFSDELCKIAAAQAGHAAQHRQALYEALRKGSQIKIRVSKDPEVLERYGGGYFDQVKNEIVLSQKNHDTLAHELGHANIHQFVLGRAIQHPLVRRAFSLTPLAAVGAGILMAKGKQWGAALPLATAVPTLMSEAMASNSGRKLLERVGARAREVGGYRKRMWEAWKTYPKSLIQRPLYGSGLVE